MDQRERRLYLLQELLRENKEYRGIKIPQDTEGQKRLLRSLMNIRPPKPVSGEFLQIQDAYLSGELEKKEVVDVDTLQPVQEGICLWQGDITLLKADAVVNAANSQMLGCFCPCHGCIDNAVHTYSGIQLRLACADIMQKQGHEEETGGAKITPAFNLPSRYVLHTVGPVVFGQVTERDRELLASCYRSCLELAARNGLASVAFCCISTGEFHFPNQEAAAIAVETVQKFLREDGRVRRVVFNVFKDMDFRIYKKLLMTIR